MQSVITKNAALISKARFALEGTGTYPDATFTLRLAYDGRGLYGQWTYRAADHRFCRRLRTRNRAYPFALPSSWIAAEKSVNPQAKLNFVTSNDIIGGNSGSPIISRSGEVIGLVFDGNIQSLGGEFGYDGRDNRGVGCNQRHRRSAEVHLSRGSARERADPLGQQLKPGRLGAAPRAPTSRESGRRHASAGAQLRLVRPLSARHRE